MWRSQRSARLLLVLPVLLAAATALADAPPPDSELNPVNGSIETVDAPWTGQNFDIRHVINPGGGKPITIIFLSTNPGNDLGPRLTISPASGDTWVVWWRDGAVPSVLSRRRWNSTGAWTPERVQSDPALRSSRPSAAFDGTHPWVAYQAESGGTTLASVQIIEDEPTPFILGHSVPTHSSGGSIDALVLFESGHLWMSWIDDATNVGWIEYDFATGTWSAPSYEPFGQDSVSEARSRVRAAVLSN